jgi:profilin
MASWDDYVYKNLMGTNTCSGALIAGLTDGQIWAQGGDIQGKVTADELKRILDGFNDPTPLQMDGLRIATERYIYQGGAEEGAMRAKKGASGAIIVKTNMAIILATYNDTIQPGQCSNVVQKLGDYLKGVGY